jgi:hypothetical protein
LPKIAPTIVDRPQVADWLQRCATAPLRLLIAPAGSGKTTSAVVYARAAPHACCYLKISAGIPLSALVAQLGRVTGNASIRTYDGLLEHLAQLPRTDIIVDNVDGADGEARELLGRIFSDVPEGIAFIYLARSAKALDVNAAQARGLAEICDEARFAFDAADTIALAHAVGRSIDASSVAGLLEATHGWAIAVAGACRAAAAHRLSFDEALVYWRRTNDAAIRELVIDALRHVPEAVRRAFTSALSGPLPPEVGTLTTLRRYGLFVAVHAQQLAINPLLHFEPSDQSSFAGDDVPRAFVEMFGRFMMSIDGRSVAWERRRDRQIIQYLAMQPNGRATRAELIAAFWPDGDAHLARQSLRTAFCTIRSAIGACVGSANVAKYFVADHVVELKLEHTAVSARRFAELFERGQSADAENDLATALAHYREAERLYRSGFLAGEPPMPWALPHEERLARMFDRIAQRLGQTRFDYLSAGSRAPRDVA